MPYKQCKLCQPPATAGAQLSFSFSLPTRPSPASNPRSFCCLTLSLRRCSTDMLFYCKVSLMLIFSRLKVRLPLGTLYKTILKTYSTPLLPLKAELFPLSLASSHLPFPYLNGLTWNRNAYTDG